MMELSHLLEPARCLADLRYGDKAACLGDLAKRAAAALGLDRPAIVEALLHREGLGSTGLGNGIALPHARLAGLGAPYVLLARLREPIAFEAIDGQPVDLVCLVLTPADSDAAARTSLACVARRLRDPQVLGAIRKARTGPALYAAAAGTAA